MTTREELIDILESYTRAAVLSSECEVCDAEKAVLDAFDAQAARIAGLEADLKTERLRVEASKAEWEGLDRYYRAALARKDEYKSALARLTDTNDEYKTALVRLTDAGEAAWHNLMAVHPREQMSHDLVTAARNGIRAALNAAREVLDEE